MQQEEEEENDEISNGEIMKEKMYYYVFGVVRNWKVSLARQSFLDLLCSLRNSTRGAEILKYLSNDSRV